MKALKTQPVSAVFKDSKGNLIVSFYSNEMFHTLLFDKQPKHTDVYCSSEAMKTKQNTIKLIRKFITPISKEFVLPISFMSYKPLEDYGTIEITEDFFNLMYDHGIIPFNDARVKSFMAAHSISVIHDVDYPSMTTKVNLSNFIKYRKKPEWSPEDLDNIKRNAEKYANFELPSRRSIFQLKSMIEHGAVSSVLFYGPAATFKTTTAFLLSTVLEYPAEIISITSGTEPEDITINTVAKANNEVAPEHQDEYNELVQKFLNKEITEEEFNITSRVKFDLNTSGLQLKYIYSIILKRFEHGGFAIVDEMNNGRPSVFAALHNMLDGTDKITTNEGRTIYKNRFFVFFACINPLYDDKEDLEQAMVSRFDYTVRFENPTVDEFKTIIYKSIPGFKSDAFVEAVYSMGESLNSVLRKERSKYFITFREMQKFVVGALLLKQIAFRQKRQVSLNEVKDLLENVIVSKTTLKLNEKKHDSIMQLLDTDAEFFVNFLAGDVEDTEDEEELDIMLDQNDEDEDDELFNNNFGGVL